MPDTLPNLTSNLAKNINKNKCKNCIDKCIEYMEESCNTKYKDCKFSLEYVKIKGKILQIKWLKCNKKNMKKVQWTV